MPRVISRLVLVGVGFVLAFTIPVRITAQSSLPTLHGIPMSGTEVPRLNTFDDAVTDYMSRNDISSGALAITNGSEIIFQRGYGWTSSAHTAYLRPDALFRLASITKPVTKAAIKQLADEGRLRLTDHAICVGNNQPCQLNITPYRTPDSRLGSITIQQLIDHTGGWDRDITPDLTYQYTAAATDLGVAKPPSREDMARWIAGRPLEFTPGARYAYANVGFLYLGMIVEKVAGTGWFEYVRPNIFDAAGGTGAEIVHGRTLLVDRDRREPAYEDPNVSSSVFSPFATVPDPDGSFYLETRTGIGNVVTTSRNMAQFMTRYRLQGERRTASNTTLDSHTGSYPGTNTLLRQYSSGVGIAVLFNRSIDLGGTAANIDDLRRLFDSIVSQTTFTGFSAIPKPDPNAPMPTPPASRGNPTAALSAAGSSTVAINATLTSGCTTTGSWTTPVTVREASGVGATIIERYGVFDGREASRANVNIVVAGGGRSNLTYSWCSSATADHTLVMNYIAMDGFGNRYTFSTPEMRLQKR